MMIHCLLVGTFMSLIGMSYPQTAIIRDVVPDVILVLPPNQFDDDIEPLQDQCTSLQALLSCPGHPSILFDGVIGQSFDEDEDLRQYYTWRQEFTPRPYVAMAFDPPLVELPNTTLYFYHAGGQIQAGISLSMCFSRSPDYSPCNRIEVPQLTDPDNGVVVHSVMLPTNATSVTYLRIDMELLPPHNEHEYDYIFLSEIRVAERLQVQTTTPTPSPMMTSYMMTSSIMTSHMMTSSHTFMTSTPTIAYKTTVTSYVPSSDNDDNSVGVAVISGAVVGTLLLIIIIITIVIVVIILCNRRRKKSRKAHNIEIIDYKGQQPLNTPNSQQHIHGTSDQSQHDHTDSGTLQLGAEVEPKSKLETTNALYMPTKVKSLDSLLRYHDTSRSDVIGCDVIITPNPSYAVGQNSSETGKECEYQYDYVQIDDGSVQHDKVVGATTSGGDYDKVIDPADNVNIDPNPSYLLPQDVKLEDNPSYTQLLASSYS